MFKSILCVAMILSTVSFAQTAENLPARVRALEQNVRYLQNTIARLDERLRNLENGIIGQPPIVPQPVLSYSAILVDTGYSKTFLGVGSTRLQAEAQARQECGKSVHSSYCNGAVRFGQAELGTRGYFCIVTDTGYGKTFSAEGLDAIQAEAKAKQACQASVHSSYCGNAPVRCEAVH